MVLVVKRDGRECPFDANKIKDRLLRLVSRPSMHQLSALNDVNLDLVVDTVSSEISYQDSLSSVNIDLVLDRVTDSLSDRISTQQIDDLACEVCASLSSVHFEYNELAGRLLVSNLHKQTMFGSFSDRMCLLAKNGVLNDATFEKILKHKDALDNAVDYFRDYKISFFGLKTLLKSYLIKGDVDVCYKSSVMCSSFCKKRNTLEKPHEDPVKDSKNSEKHIQSVEILEHLDKNRKLNTFNDENKSDSHESEVNPNLLQTDSIKDCGENLGANNESSAINTLLSVDDSDSCGMHDFEPSYMNSSKKTPVSLKDVVIERPQDLFMRVAVGIHDDLESILLTYELLSRKFFTHATPTLFNAGTKKPQMSSCFLLDILSDSIDGIYASLRQCAFISKNSGGIGISITKIRASNAKIGFSGTSNGLVPMLRVFDATARYVDQGGNKRPGTIACFLEPWHSDVFDFIELRKNTGKDEKRCRDLFLGLWVPDLFMQRVQDDKNWTLMCPNDAYFITETPIESHERFNEIKDLGLILQNEEYHMSESLNTENVNPNTSPPLNDSNTHDRCSQTFLNKTWWNVQGRSDLRDDLSHMGKVFSTFDDLKTYLMTGNDTSYTKPPNNNTFATDDHPVGKKEAYVVINGKIHCFVKKGLYEMHSEEFNSAYVFLEENLSNKKTIKAQALWKAIIEAQIETGTPYILYKDACNQRNNQKNLGTLKGSNLCTEILQYTDHDEIAVCNLASIALPQFVKEIKAENTANVNCSSNNAISTEFESSPNNSAPISNNKVSDSTINYNARGFDVDLLDSTTIMSVLDNTSSSIADNIYHHNKKSYYFDYDSLIHISEIITMNLNKVIDKNYYPLKEAEKSNKRHRPIGIGVQGLADTFYKLNLDFEGKEARLVNKRIFECIYYGAMRASIKLAKIHGPYESFKGSPLEKGILQFDYFTDNFDSKTNTLRNTLYNATNGLKDSSENILDKDLNLDWDSLRSSLKQYGCRNSLLIAPMPTASTSQILGFNECIEPTTSNIYTRRTLAGEFQVVNKYLMEDLLQLNKWDSSMKNYLIENEGSIQLLNLPADIKNKYKNVWEMKMKNIIDMQKDRQMFIDQSTSMNLFVESPTYSKLTSMHFYAWKGKLKTGMYYLRTKPKVSAIKFTVNKELAKGVETEFKEGQECSMEDGCLTCSG